MKKARKEVVQDGEMVGGPIVWLPLEKCVPTPDNEPVDVNEDRFLSICRTVAAGGVRVPIMVRPHPTEPGKYEIRDGERRWRAAMKANQTTIPAIIKLLDDAEAAALTEILNTDRRELPPLRQGALVAQVLAAHGGDLKAAAAVLGQTIHWVATRAQLAALADEWKAELANAESRYCNWTMAHWIQIARLPAQAQHRAFNELKKMYGGIPKTAQELEEFLAGMQQLLKNAAWKLDDGQLVRKAGACTGCIKRTEAQGQLFYERLDPAEVQRDDRCLDAGCWRRKVKVHAEAKIAETLAKHPDAVKVSATHVGQDALKSYEYAQAKKGDAGAVLAVVVSPERAGEMMYVKVDRRNERQKAESAKPPTPEEKLKSLRRIQARRKDLTMDDLVGQVLRSNQMKQPKKSETIVRLAAVYGVILNDVRAASKMFKAPLEKVYAALWRGVLESVMSYGSDEAAPMDALLEAGGVKMSDLQAEVEKAVPEPKEIAELEAEIKAGKKAKAK